MSMQVGCNPYARCKIPGYEALTRVSELSEEDRKSAVCIVKYLDAARKAQEELQNKKQAEIGVQEMPPFAVFLPIMKVSDGCANETLSKLRDMFSIPVIVIDSDEDDIPDSFMRGNTIGTYRKFRISEEMLKRMSGDLCLFQDITDKMKRWLDGTCEFLGNHGGTIDRMEMYISETGIVYAYTENYDAPESAVKKAKAELNDLIDFLIKWLSDRDNITTRQTDSEKETSAEDTSEYLVETVLSS